MLRAALRSGVLHIAVIFAAYVGVPHLLHESPPVENVIVVDMVPIAEQRNLPNRPIEPAPEPEPEPKPEPEPIAETPPEATPPPPPPPPEPEPEPVAEPAPPPEPEVAAAEPAPPPEPAPEPEPAPAESERLPSEIDHPAAKPEPPQQLAFERALESLEETAPEPPRTERAPEPEPAAADPIEKLLAVADTPYRSEAALSMTEIDSIREQIRRNWNVPAGARDAHITEVRLRIQLAQDGTVRQVEVVDQQRMRSDRLFRTMAESAVRAVNKTGRIVNLAPEKYHLWRDIVVTFNPKDMFG
jgi:outer membrane biosynthesis protein TonB